MLMESGNRKQEARKSGTRFGRQEGRKRDLRQSNEEKPAEEGGVH
jgi:hypothetical protein